MVFKQFKKTAKKCMSRANPSLNLIVKFADKKIVMKTISVNEHT